MGDATRRHPTRTAWWLTRRRDTAWRCLLLGVAGWLMTQPVTAAPAKEAPVETATFAGGCFWCMQPPFDKTPGVVQTTVGYTGGTTVQPTYEQVCSGTTGHAEAIQVTYDPTQVTYRQLLEVFWHNINPTQVDGQFADHGRQYRTAIFYHSNEQQRLAEASKQALQQSGRFTDPIATEIAPAATFYPAEEHHQQYYKKNFIRYKLYRVGSGREGYLKRTWGEP